MFSRCGYVGGKLLFTEMITKKQIHELPKGDYPNWRLMQMFPKQQGPGRSAKMLKVKGTGEKGQETFVQRLINQFTGKFIDPTRRGKKK